jgi:hypothetical protein
MSTYEKPSLTDIGSMHQLTLSTINKAAGTGDVIVINGESISVPGGSVTSVS